MKPVPSRCSGGGIAAACNRQLNARQLAQGANPILGMLLHHAVAAVTLYLYLFTQI